MEQSSQIIETERLLLRPVAPSDAAAIYAYSSEPDVGPSAGWKPHESLEETETLMKTVFLGQEGVFAVLLKETGALIGTLGLIADPKRENPKARMLGYAIGKPYWGRGYMTEAAGAAVRWGFETLSLELVSAYCYPKNGRSRRVLQKLGFQYEGTLSRCEQLYNGEILDHACYALHNTERD